jgi:steroid delta-isomerase
MDLVRGRAAVAGCCVALLAACSSSAKSSSSPVTATSLAATATTTTVSPTTTIPAEVAVLQAYVDAFNRGDAHAAAATFSENAQFTTPLGSCSPCTGRSTIEQKLAAAITAGTKLKIANATVNGNVVTAKTTLTSSQFPLGVKRALGSVMATVDNGAIVRLDQTYDRSDTQTDALFKSLASGE